MNGLYGLRDLGKRDRWGYMKGVDGGGVGGEGGTRRVTMEQSAFSTGYGVA